ncbi:uncharacterized protein LOC131881187 isoform X2 [Tigriopus californicus]|uniref:uncharacterized protein LOC131881187 isoform X2 n=1 Tax=Tigriopus californicus TaxID=6832 RepID=UPI0027D9F4FD|nr:uncharacterized protein LOC131881187 isoform X2 [Tigriopus californicus]
MSSHRSGAESPQLTESENAYSEPIFYHRPLPGKRISQGGSSPHRRKLSLPHSMTSSHYYMPAPPYSPRSPARSLVSSSSCSSSRPISSTGFYKTKKTTTGFFKRRCTVEDEGSFRKLDSGEIQVASGEWIKEHMSHSGVIQVKKKTSRHYVPTTPVDLIKSNKNIKRSWTISNPSGTGGPQIQTRSQSDPRNPFSDDPRLPPPKIAPPLFLNIPPPPTTSPPPIPTNQRYVPAFQPPGVMPRRNIPLRSQSMSTADHSTRFYPHRRPPMERAELADTDTDLMDPRKYRTLEGMVGRGRGGHAIITHPENGGYNTNSLERGMRRRLPDIPPSRSLPRPAKRGQSDSRSRDRNGDQKRSQSFGNELDESRRGNHYLSDGPHVKDSSKNKEGRVVREPTPDYDGSSITGDPVLSGKQNPHLGITSLPDTERSHEVYFADNIASTAAAGRVSANFPGLPDYHPLDLAYTVIEERPEDEALATESEDNGSVLEHSLLGSISQVSDTCSSRPLIVIQTWNERQGIEEPSFSRGSSIRSGLRGKRGSRKNSQVINEASVPLKPTSPKLHESLSCSVTSPTTSSISSLPSLMSGSSGKTPNSLEVLPSIVQSEDNRLDFSNSLNRSDSNTTRSSYSLDNTSLDASDISYF